MKWGFTGKEATLEDVLSCVDKGWYPLVTQLVTDLAADGWDGTVSQVKEKFGGLRFYADNVGDSGYDLIQNAEAKSTKICEVCGEPGYVRTGGWLRALCDEHSKKE